MGVKYNPKPIQGVPTASALNRNFNAIQQALETALSRFPETGNQMQDDIDLNSFTLINMREASVGTEPVTFNQVRNLVTDVNNNPLATLTGLLSIFGDEQAVIGNASFQPTINGSSIDVSEGGLWVPSVPDFRYVGATSFSVDEAGTYYFYITEDNEYSVEDSNQGNDGLAFTVEYDGTTITSFSQLNPVILSFIDLQDSLDSNAYGQTFSTLDERSEETEGRVLDNESNISANAQNIQQNADDLADHENAADPHGQYLLEADASPVATSNDYNDLDNQPTIPNGDLADKDQVTASDVDSETSISGYALVSNGDGTATWQEQSGSGGGGDATTLEGEDGSYYLSRVNHTDTQPMSTISDAGALATFDMSGGADGQYVASDGNGGAELRDIPSGGSGGQTTALGSMLVGYPESIGKGSSSSYATKGNTFRAIRDSKAVGIRVSLFHLAGESYKAVLVRMVGQTTEIDEVIAESDEKSFSANAPSQGLPVTFPFSPIADIQSGNDYSFVIVRTDGTEAATCRVPFPSDPPPYSLYGFEFVRGVREDVFPAMGEYFDGLTDADIHVELEFALIIGEIPSGIEEAPQDGQLYARQNGMWVVVPSS